MLAQEEELKALRAQLFTTQYSRDRLAEFLSLAYREDAIDEAYAEEVPDLFEELDLEL